MDPDELGAWLRLTATPGVGNIAARRLLARFGLPQAIFQQTEAALQHCVSAPQARALCTLPPGWQALCTASRQWLCGAGAQEPARAIVTLGDARYPQALLHTPDPPLLLYLAGPAPLLAHQPFPEGRCLAMVGSRNPSAQGAQNARQFARALHGAGLCIVSGLALGVDAAAHEGALQSAQEAQAAAQQTRAAATIAVMGTGLDRIYPRGNHALARRIAAHGLLVSEFPLGTPPLATNFPKRNRIISGLCQGTLVVEATLASGSLITARLAAEQGREVFAIPGSIHAPQARGCHALIRQGAKLAESAQDILEELQLPAAAGAALTQATAAPGAPAGGQAQDALHTRVLAALGFDPTDLDTLAARTALATPALQVALLELELAGQIAQLPGGLFQRLARG